MIMVYNATESLSFKAKITCQIGNNGTKQDAIMVPLKYLSNFGALLK